MGIEHAIARQCGHDVRRTQMAHSSRDTRIHAEGDDKSARALDRICARLVQRATAGMLTLEGDRVVSRHHLRRETTNAADDTLIGTA